MDRNQSGIASKIKAFFNPPTQAEKQKRSQQLKDAAFFAGCSAVLLLFRKQIISSIEGMSSP